MTPRCRRLPQQRDLPAKATGVARYPSAAPRNLPGVPAAQNHPRPAQRRHRKLSRANRHLCWRKLPPRQPLYVALAYPDRMATHHCAPRAPWPCAMAEDSRRQIAPHESEVDGAPACAHCPMQGSGARQADPERPRQGLRSRLSSHHQPRRHHPSHRIKDATAVSAEKPGSTASRDSLDQNGNRAQLADLIGGGLRNARVMRRKQGPGDHQAPAGAATARVAAVTWRRSPPPRQRDRGSRWPPLS